MKKRIIGVILSTTLILNLSGCYISFGEDYKEADMVNIDKSIDYNGENEIEIDVSVGKVDIYGYDGNEIIVTGKVVDSEKNIQIKKYEDEISIKDSIGIGSDLNIFKNRNVGMDIEIKIPKEFKGDIDLNYGAGDMIVHDLLCKEIDIEGGAGRFNIENIVFENLDYDGGVGETNIKLAEKCGDIDIDGGVGSVNIEMSEVGGNLSFDGGVGSAKIKIPETASVYFNTESGIGNIKLNAKTSGENIYEFEINVGVGEVEIYN